MGSACCHRSPVAPQQIETDVENSQRPSTMQQATVPPVDKKWGYSEGPDQLGPASWGEKYPAARGQHQSPIDLKNGRLDPRLQTTPVETDFVSTSGFVACNTGSTVKFTPKPGDSVGCIHGGPLTEKYQLAQFHFHWGAEDGRGSEHLINGHACAAEAHFVFSNTDLYGGDDLVSSRERGLAVLGVFLKIGDSEHSELKKLVDCFSEIKQEDQEKIIEEDIDISQLLPAERDYYTYHGSLTTPPCYESVTWIVFSQPISVSVAQLGKFRELLNKSGHSVADNFRPVQQMNGRLLWKNFEN